MAGHPEETPLPGEVVGLLGADIVDHAGAGVCRVVSGGGLVAKVGPPDVVSREAAVLASPDLPLAVPAVVDSGPGWLVMAAERDDESPWNEADLHAALSDLARLHDAFEHPADGLGDRLPGGSPTLLRKPFSPEAADDLLRPVRRLAASLPGSLAALLDDPGPLVRAAAAEPPTLLHGDPWPDNILRPSPGRRVWIDWEMAALGPAAADLATWLSQTPWATGAAAGGEHVEIYLSSRSRPVDRARFQRALDAATVLWFLAYDLPHVAKGVAAPDVAEKLKAAALAAADRLEPG